MHIEALEITLKSALVALLAGAAGCFSLETASLAKTNGGDFRLHAGGGEPVSHIVVANNGWFLFNLWPLASGNAAEGGYLPFSFFRNDVREDILQGRLTKHARATNCDVADLAMLSSEQVLLSIPGTSLPLPIPYIFTYRRMQVTGVLVKHSDVSQREREEARRRALSKEMKLLINEIPNGDHQ